MPKEIRVRIYPDGRIVAETSGIKGKACRGYIPILEELLNAETVSSAYSEEYYDTEQVDHKTLQEQAAAKALDESRLFNAPDS